MDSVPGRYKKRLGSSLLVNDNLRVLFEHPKEEVCDDDQLELYFLRDNSKKTHY